jgi:rubrerythrin
MSATEKIDKGDPAELLDLLWRCGLCGHQSWMATQPDRCNGCGTAQAPMMGRTMVEWRALLLGQKTA